MSVKRIFYLLVFILLIAACKPKLPSVPPSCVSKDTAINILVDVHIIECGLVQTHQVMPDTIKTLTKNLYSLLFRKYNIDQRRFEESAKFYMSNPELFEEIYSEAFNRLVRLQSQTKHIKKRGEGK